MRFRKDNIDRFLCHDVDVDNRIIYLGSDGDTEGSEHGVAYDLSKNFIKNLLILDGKAPDGDEAITVFMNNPGGDYYHSLAMYDAMKSCKNHITVMVFGQSFSAASIILQAADERLLSQRSRLLIHYGSEYYAGHTQDLIKFGEESKRCVRELEDLYLEQIHKKHPQFTREDLQKRMNFDCWLSAKEAVKLGLADGIFGG